MAGLSARCGRAQPPLRLGSARAPRPCSARALDERDRRAGGDGVALLDRELFDHARLVGSDLVLHLHRLDDADDLALLDGLALLDEDLPHVALQGRDELVGAARAARRSTL